MRTKKHRRDPVYSLRLGVRVRRLLEAAAALHDESLAEYMRRTAADAARRDLTQNGEGRDQ